VAPDGLIDPQFLPAPRQIWKALEGLTLSGELAKHLGASLVRIGAAWLIGTAAGECGLPFISALFPAPKIALLPLLILWFGIGVASKVAIIARCRRIDSARNAGGRQGEKSP